MKRFLPYILNALKVILPIGLIVWLVLQAYQNDTENFDDLLSRPKEWHLLAASAGLFLGAVMISFIRWYFLVRAIRLPFRLRDAFRLGFLGFLFNFVGFGSNGGDLMKAVFIARLQPDKKTEAVATVVVDRLFGLYGLLLFVSLAFWISGIGGEDKMLSVVAKTAYSCMVIGTVFFGMVLLPGFTQGSLWEWLTSLPKIGSMIERLVDAVRIYRKSPRVLGFAVVASASIHAIITLSIYTLTIGLFDPAPTLAEQGVIVPVSNFVAAIPIAPAGLGTYEFAMKELFDRIPADDTGKGKGFVVALGFRLLTFIVASIGIVYYWFGKSEVQSLMQEEKKRMKKIE